MFLTNAFSLNMLPLPFNARCIPLTVAEASEMAKTATSAVGHADTAAVFSDVLGVPVAYNRATIQLASGDKMLVGQYKGPRLPEGATTLPEGATIQFMLVEVGTP